MGTGPYMFKNYTSGVSGQFVRNPNYFKTDAGGARLPYLDGINISIIAARSAQYDAFIGGRADLLTPWGGFYAKEDWDRIKTQAPTATIAISRPPQTGFFWFNTTRKPLDDVRVRKAIALVIEQDKVAASGYGSAEMNQAGRALFSSTYKLPEAEITRLLGWDKPIDSRIAEAKKLLGEAGMSGGFKLQLVGSQTPEYQRIYQYLADWLKRNLNIESEIILQPFVEARKLRDAGQFDIWLEEMISSTGDPDDAWQYFGTGMPSNISRYSNPALDALWKQQSAALVVADRQKLTQQIERQILTDVPVVPARGSIFGVAWHPYVKGYVQPNATYGHHMVFEQVWLDK